MVRVEEQHAEQRLFLGASKRERSASVKHLEWAEDAVVHDSVLPLNEPTRRALRLRLDPFLYRSTESRFTGTRQPTCGDSRMRSATKGGAMRRHRKRNEENVELVTIVASLGPAGATRRIDEPRPGNCPFEAMDRPQAPQLDPIREKEER